MEEFKINDKVVLLKAMPFDLSKGDECIISNITATLDGRFGYELIYHVKKDKESRHEFSVRPNEIKKIQ